MSDSHFQKPYHFWNVEALSSNAGGTNCGRNARPTVVFVPPGVAQPMAVKWFKLKQSKCMPSSYTLGIQDHK